MNRILTLVTVCALVLPAQLLSQTTTVILVRHAEQDYASDDRDPILSAAGEARAEELVRVLREVKIDAIYSTPLHRTRETAKPVAQLLPVFDSALGVAAKFASGAAQSHIAIVSLQQALPQLFLQPLDSPADG